jgi:transposase
VNIHKNAVLTPRGRERLIKSIEQGESVAAAAAAVGISERTAWRWRDRHRAAGREGLVDRSSPPDRSPNRSVRRTQERQIIRLRKKRWTQAAIAEQLKMAMSTVGAVCRRSGVGRLRDLEPRLPVVCYERERAGRAHPPGYQETGAHRANRASHPRRPQSERRGRRVGILACLHRRRQPSLLRRGTP